MTDQPVLDRSATEASGYTPGTKLPEHLGEAIVRVERLEKYFGTNHVLRGIDLEVRQREAVMVIGRSGSGKPSPSTRVSRWPPCTWPTRQCGRATE